jgi:O-antigen/teichoic acid export membrane protein
VIPAQIGSVPDVPPGAESVAVPGSLRVRFAKGAIWSLIGTLVSQGLSLLAAVVTARFLGKTGFGELGMINSTVGMFGLLAGLGLGLTTTKYVAELRMSDPKRAGRIIALTSMIAMGSAAMIALGAVLFAPEIAQRALNARHLAPELRIGALLMLLNVLNGVQTGTLSGFEAFKEVAQSNFLRGVLSFPLLIAGVLLWHLPGAVWGLAAAAGVGWTINHLMLRRICRAAGVRVVWQGAWSERSVLLAFSLPALLADIAAGPAIWAANAILVNQKNGYAELGLFSAANQWRTALMFLPNILLQVALPLLASFDAKASESGRAQFSKTFEITQTLTIAVVFPLGILLMFLSDFVIGFYGPQFRHGAASLIGVACTVMIMAVGAATGPGMQALGKMWLVFNLNLCWAVVMLAGVWISAPRAGALSLAYAPAVAYAVITVIAFVCLRAELNRRAMPRAIGAILLALAAAVISASLSAQARRIAAGPAFVLALFLTLTVLTEPYTRRILFSAIANWRNVLRSLRTDARGLAACAEDSVPR